MLSTFRKRLLLPALVLVAMLLFSACSKYIGKAKAKEIALADAQLTKSDVRDLECELDKDVGRPAVYEVDFEVGFDDYEYEIDAETGEILKSKID